MLTGMLERSSGDAIITGHRISDGMDSIRKVMGVCPQHDVPWLELSFHEHLLAYGALQGLPKEELASRAEEMMQQVGITGVPSRAVRSASSRSASALSASPALSFSRSQPRAWAHAAGAPHGT